LERGPAELSSTGRRMVQRPRLTRLLAETESRVILLVAPAGYGKTTLAREWLAHQQLPHVWYQATDTSSDAADLALGVAAAVSSVVPHSGNQLRARLKTSKDPAAEAEYLARDLADDLSSWPDELWLVMDDYHLIAETAEAERFVRGLVEGTSAQFLIASRKRPSWVSARKLLYGEVTEFGRHMLAMTPDEAAEALSNRHDEMTGLVALAEGWPAVIGLAALLPHPFLSGETDVPETLHEYFAEELYQGLSEETKWGLTQLALAPHIDNALIEALFGPASENVVQEGERAGFLTSEAGSQGMHPLLRQFLRSKAAKFERDLIRDAARRIGQFYVQAKDWDAAAAIASEFGFTDLMLNVLEDALESALSEGRLATVRRWLASAEAASPTAPIVRFAAIEIAFRAGDWTSARAKATDLARSIPQDHALASRIYLRAGQLAHLDDRQGDALQLLTAAKECARTPVELRKALWSRFVTLTDLEERNESEVALHDLEAMPPLDVDDLMRASQGRLQFAMRWGGLTDALQSLDTAIDLVDRSTDPIVRTGFLQTYGTALSLAARYTESSQIAERQTIEAQRFGLEWVLPHALEMQAIAEFGLRNFDQALRSLARARQLATEQGNIHTQVNTVVLTARIHLCRGAPDRAVETLETREPRMTNPGMEGDYLATQAFALACCGRVDEARDLIAGSERVTTHLEARVLRAFARVVASHFERTPQQIDPDLLGKALAIAEETGNFDGFVCAYRAFPELLTLIARLPLANANPFVTIVRSLDPALAETIGLKPPTRGIHDGEPLTAREQEVLDLVRQGLTNREIARTLWIAESTVKVHVHHVLEKLGARSRTEAASLTEPVRSPQP
jgi:LuxR family transcriptional regulator, maltose regulon positive regulatory protein